MTRFEKVNTVVKKPSTIKSARTKKPNGDVTASIILGFLSSTDINHYF